MWLVRLSQDAVLPCNMGFQDSKVETVGVREISLQVSAILTSYTILLPIKHRINLELKQDNFTRAQRLGNLITGGPSYRTSVKIHDNIIAEGNVTMYCEIGTILHQNLLQI